MAQHKFAMGKILKIVVINLSCLIGCVLAIFLVPARIDLAVFLLICIGSFALINAAVFFRPKTSNLAQANRTDKFRSVTIWTVIILSLVLGLLARLGYLR